MCGKDRKEKKEKNENKKNENKKRRVGVLNKGGQR